MKFRVKEHQEVVGWSYVEAEDQEAAEEMFEDEKGTDPLDHILTSEYIHTDWESIQDERDITRPGLVGIAEDPDTGRADTTHKDP